MFRGYLLVLVVSILVTIQVAPVYAAPSISLGSTASYSLGGSIQVTQSCSADPITYSSQACQGIVPTPGPPVIGQPFLYDDFNYANVSQAQAAGWQAGGPASFFSFMNSSIVLLNDGSQGAGLQWRNIPSGLSNWSVSTKEAWVGNSAGVIALNIITSGHYYQWAADGYYRQFDILHDTCCAHPIQIPGYDSQMNVYHVLRMDMLNGVLSFYFDGTLMTTFVEQDTSPGNTDLARIDIGSAWNTDNAYDWVQAAPLSASPPIPIPPPSPTTVRVDLSGNVGWNVQGLSSSQANLLVSHNLAVSISPVPFVSFTPLTESGSYEQSINLSTRVETQGTASALVMAILPLLVPALSGLTTSSASFGSPSQTMLTGQLNQPEYTQWWVNGPLVNGSPVQILDGWSSVTGAESLNLGGTIGTRQGWIVTSQLSQTFNLNIPNVNSPLGPSSTSTAKAKIGFQWSFDKSTDLLLKNNDTISFSTLSVTPSTIYVGAGPVDVSVTRTMSATVTLTIQLSSTSLKLNGGQKTATLNPLSPMSWMSVGLVGLAAGVVSGALLWQGYRTRRSVPPDRSPPSPTPY